MRVHGLSSRAILGRFYNRYEQEFSSGWLPQLAATIESDQESETYKWLGMVPMPREWIGERQASPLRTNSFTIVNKTWEDTLRVNVDDIRRDKTGQIMMRVADLAAAAARHPQKLVSTLISTGGATACYDGQYFFDTDHSEGSSGTQKNLLTSAEVAALDVATATAPTQAEMSLAILGCISYMLGFLDDKGEPMNGEARSFAVMTPTPLYPAAMAAVFQPTVLAATGAVVPNSLVGSGFSLTVISNPRLSWTTDFCVFRTDGVAKPFIYQVELPPQMSVVAEGSELETTHNEHLYGLKAVYNCGYGMWQHAVKATLS
jgi:phage major head subunit gpT-like protein